MEEERCYDCDCPTGRAGRDDDSMVYYGRAYCELCWPCVAKHTDAEALRFAAEWLETLPMCLLDSIDLLRAEADRLEADND